VDVASRLRRRDRWRGRTARHRHAATEQTEQVERCLIRPVHVLEYEDRTLVLQLFEQHIHYVVRDRPGRRQSRESPAGLRSDVDDRTERTWGEERFARADEDACRPCHLCEEGANEGALANARLAAQ
jgi:hypothetical protein